MGSLALTERAPAGIGRAGRLVLLALGFAFATSAEAIRLAAGWPLDWVVIDVVPGLAFLVAGVVAWERRPDSRIGPVMVLVGFAWFPGTLAAAGHPVIDRLGGAFQGYYDGLLAWLVLAYPSGRLVGRMTRVIVAALFGVLIARTGFRLFAFRLSTDYDFALPSEADRYVADLSLRETGEGLFRVLIAGLMVVVLLLLVRRLRSETDVARRIGWPMVVAGLAVAAGVLVELGALALATTSPERRGAWALGDLTTAVSGSAVAIAFGVGLVRSRLARQSVADLVLELGDAERPALQEVVARTLRDPSVRLLYPAPEGAGYIDAAGQPRELPGSADLTAVTRVEARGETLAVLLHDPALSEQPELLRSVVAAVRLAIENERLAAEVRAQLAEVRASRARIVAAGDEQRRRVERDIHDGAQQRLVTLALRLQMARAAAGAEDAGLADALDAAGRDLDAAIAELRELARGLHPSILASDGLGAAIEALAERTPAQVSVRVPDERFDEAVESAAYYVVAESLTNVVRYAGATRVGVTIEVRDELLRVEVVDDGVGGADPGRGSGLRGLDDRVAAIGGRLRIESPQGGGTTVRAELPCG